MNQKQKINKVKTGLNLYRLIEASGKTRIEIAEYLELESTRVIYDWTSGITTPTRVHQRLSQNNLRKSQISCETTAELSK